MLLAAVLTCGVEAGMTGERNVPQLPNGRRYGDVVPGEWRVVARSKNGSVKPPGWRLPWRPAPPWVASRVSEEIGPLMRSYVGIVLYRDHAADAEVAAVQLQASLDAYLEFTADVTIDRWNPTLAVWQPRELWQTANEHEVQILATVRCSNKPEAIALAEELRRQGQLYVASRGRSVVLGSTGEAQAQMLLSGRGPVKVKELRRRFRKQLVQGLVYDRKQAGEKGGWLSYDPSD